jgi:nucleoside-diphosphate-sugar epimerase
MNKVLVTGGMGFLGSSIVTRLKDLGEEVRIFANQSSKEKYGIIEHEEIIWGDIRDQASVEEAVKGMDSVIHLVSNFRRVGSDKKEAYSINVEGTDNVLNASLKYGIKRLVHCSTIGVHGHVKEIPSNEESPYNPGDLYQETKLIAEKRVWDFNRKTGLPITVVRPISAIGPGDVRMLKLFRGIKKGVFFIVGKGEALFQPSYIDDIVDGFILCLNHEKAVGEVFIVGGEEYVSLNELVGTIASELNVQPPKIRLPLPPLLLLASACEKVCAPLGIEPPLHRRRMSFFQNSRAFSVKKARAILGYEPKNSLRQGIRKTIAWYTENGWL